MAADPKAAEHLIVSLMFIPSNKYNNPIYTCYMYTEQTPHDCIYFLGPLYKLFPTCKVTICGPCDKASLKARKQKFSNPMAQFCLNPWKSEVASTIYLFVYKYVYKYTNKYVYKYTNSGPSKMTYCKIKHITVLRTMQN